MLNVDLLIKRCSLITPDYDVISDCSIVVNKGKIIEIGKSHDEIETKYLLKSVLDGHNKLAIPGLVDAHTHTLQQLLRVVVDPRPMVYLRLLLPFERALTPDDIYLSALLACVQMIKAGITCFADSGSWNMEPVIQAVQETGMRASVARMTRDCSEFLPDSMKESAQIAVRNTEDLFLSYNGAADGRIRIAFSVTNPITASPGLVELVASAAQQYKAVVHVHLAEHFREVEYCLANYKLRPAEYFDAHGLLAPNLLAAHAVKLSDKEVKLIAERDAKPVHCPRSNFAVHGFPKTPMMRAMGISIGLGNDGAASGDLDLFSQMRILKFGLQAYYGIPIFDPGVITTREVFEMATMGSARALQWEKEIGSLETGKKADIVLLNWRQPHLYPTRDIFQTMVMVASGRDVSDVIIDGKVVLKDRQFVNLDEERIMAQASEQLASILKRIDTTDA
jgi:5-methylthioadenosine/S-adenosylhomocysteine deaminase